MINKVEDKFLSKQFGFKAYKLYSQNLISSKDLKKKIFLYIKIDLNKNFLKNIRQLKKFNFIDFNITFNHTYKLKKYKFIDTSLNLAENKDTKKIIKLSQNSFYYSRFKIDTNIPKKIYQKIQMQWIKNYFLKKRGTHMVVCKKGQNLFGFLLFKKSQNHMIIDLIAVSKNQQKKGLGKKMINYSVNKFFNGHAKITVGTQSRNQNSINFYKKLGFKIKKIQAIFHYINLKKKY